MQGASGAGPFSDHFSGRAAEYARFRPRYPTELADYLAALAPRSSLAWDAGCGSGQLSVLLARLFSRVVASDASARQIAQAPRQPHLHYLVERAEETALADGVADLCVSAQAAHWFELNRYYSQVRRVAANGGFVVMITYGRIAAPPGLEPLLSYLYEEILGPYWPPERAHVEGGYRTMSFPFAEHSPPRFILRQMWTLQSFLGYVSTWSAVGRLRRDQGEGALTDFAVAVSEEWRSQPVAREFRWPLHLRVGAV